MGTVGGKIEKEWARLIQARLDELYGFSEPNIDAVALVLPQFIFVPVIVVEKIIVPVVGRLGDRCALVMNRLFETAVMRPQGTVVTKMPFPKMAGPLSLKISAMVGNSGKMHSCP